MVSHSVLQSGGQNPTSKRSLAALDALNFFLADVVGGVGPYLAVYLKSALTWDAGAIGIAMATASICTVLFQTPAGAIVDRVEHKRAVIILSALAIAAGSLLLVAFPCFACVITAQALIGSAGAFLPPAVAAISLGLVGPLQGIIATGLGIGAGLSNLLIGFIVKFAGYNAGFLTLAGISIAAMAFFLWFMPETKQLSE